MKYLTVLIAHPPRTSLTPPHLPAGIIRANSSPRHFSNSITRSFVSCLSSSHPRASNFVSSRGITYRFIIRLPSSLSNTSGVSSNNQSYTYSAPCLPNTVLSQEPLPPPHCTARSSVGTGCTRQVLWPGYFPRVLTARCCLLPHVAQGTPQTATGSSLYSS